MIASLLKKNYVLLFLIMYGSCFGEYPETKINWNNYHQADNKANNNFKKHLSTHLSYNIRATEPGYNNSKSSCNKNNNYNPYIAYMSVSDFEQVFKTISNQYEILSSYELYVYPNFCAFARTLPCYKEFMLSLQENIKNNTVVKTNTACIPGFEYSFSWGKEKSGFHDFVNKEANNIRNNQTITQRPKHPTLQINNPHKIDLLINKWSQVHNTNNISINKRLTERINAINTTRSQNGKCFNYSSRATHVNSNDPDAKAFQNRYGTQLDCQLHTELCQTRNTMRNLEHTYSHNHYVEILAPVVYRYTAQAKNEQCPILAFELSDFCHTITQVLSHGMHILYDASSAVGKGAWKGTKDFASIEHWKNMATGTMQLGLLFADAIGQENALHYAIVLEATSDNSQAVVTAAKKYCIDTQKQKDAINLCAQATYKKIQSMSWQEILEHGTEIGTSMILDTLAFNAINGFSSAAGNLVIKQLSGALESGALLTEQYVVEVAGFGKLIIEEGATTSAKATDIIKNDLALFAKNNQTISQQIKNKITQFKSLENIIQQIRNVGDDILDIMEKAGGHTLKKHVGKTYDDLFLRAMRDTGDTISTFANKRTAIKAIKENLKHNADEIASWLITNPPHNSKKAFDFLHSYPIGEGIIKGKKNALHSLNESIIVLTPCSTNEFGFEIVTSYPIPK